MLGIEELRGELARVTYRPGWRFFLYPHRHGEGIWLSIRAELPSADHPAQAGMVNIKTAVPPIPDAAYLFEWLAYRLGRVEAHECREFLRVDGVRLHDPHADEANDE